ncbi:carboxypeptidase-like regulatory domain-containing protein [Ferrimonas aestuarii]|uniref:Carboxypeptidase regulatory-like domain-containing protein n=1 Tax=Ferrimonas aestuarii TaxID=2569539 RepID=A0A4V5NW48_9GAMM|nr:carboxypeptidase-like regulatory domain-containing protein [Ferrimonas aestuarii]TKB54954.1 carboxypeptidase regulatory-like domain-containing protein [Ferrimonas aestuarii]
MAQASADASGNQRLLDAIKRISQSYQSQASPLPVQAQIPNGEELLLELSVEGYSIADILAIKSTGSAMINLEELALLLGFNIQYQADSNRYEGWFLTPENRFALPLTVNDENFVVQLGEQHYRLDTQQITQKQDQLYVEAGLLERWFGLQIKFQFDDLHVAISSQQPLPVITQIKRTEKPLTVRKQVGKASLPEQETDYKWLAPPSVDLQLQYSGDGDRNFANYSLLGSQDLLRGNAQFYLSGTQDQHLDQARITLSKQSAQPELLGALKATNVEVGDITPIVHGTGNTTGLSRGVRFDNKGPNSINSNRTLTLEGDIQPGWDIELFHNQLLIAKQSSDQQGRYQFNDVKLVYGDNRFEVVMYGPYGEVERRVESVYLDSRSLESDSTHYAFSIAELNTGVFSHYDRYESSEGWQASGTISRNFTPWLGLELGSSLIEGKQGRRHDLSLSSNLALGDFWLMDSQYQYGSLGDHSYQLGLRGGLGDHNLYGYFERQQLRNPEDWSQGNELTEYGIELGGQPQFGARYRLNYRVGGEVWESHSRDQQQWYAAANWQAWGLGFEHGQYWLDTSDSDAQLSGNLRISSNHMGHYLKFDTEFQSLPDWQLNLVGLEWSMPIAPVVSGELDLEYRPQIEELNTRASFTWHLEQLYLNTYSNWSSNDKWSFGLLAKVSIGYQTQADSLLVSRASLANQGTLLVTVFHDLNGNGIHEVNEPVLPGVKIRAPQSYRQAHTDRDGIATLYNMPALRSSDIIVDRDSIPEPFLIPATPGVSLQPKRGLISALSVPLVEATEVDGTLYQQDSEQPAAYVNLMLVDAQQQVVARTRSEFDGYYLFTDLLPGQYQLRLDADASPNLATKKLSQHQLDLTQPGTVVAGLDLNLINPKSRFTLNLGEFHSQQIMTLFVQLLNRQHFAIQQANAQLWSQQQNSKFQLNFNLYETRSAANNGCRTLMEYGVQCSVKQMSL